MFESDTLVDVESLKESDVDVLSDSELLIDVEALIDSEAKYDGKSNSGNDVLVGSTIEDEN